MKTIELRPAYVWDCEECGEENFARGLVPECAKEDMEFIKEELGIHPDDDSGLVMMPVEVVCAFCKVRFITKHMRESE